MKQPRTKNILKNINLVITLFVVFANFVGFLLCDTNKTNFILITLFLNVCLFFFHSFLIGKEIKEKNLDEMKRESLYINYPIEIGKFSICFVVMLLGSIVSLYVVNKEVMNVAFVFTFFMSIMSMLFSSLLLLAYIYFIFPAFVLPEITTKQNKRNLYALLLTLFILFVTFSAGKFTIYSIRTIYIDKQNRYKVIKLPIQYSTQYLKLKDLTPYGKKKLSQVKLSVPFIYTDESFSYKDATSGEIFCNSMGARVPNYLEMYNIAFNKFNTFGEKYYWTSNYDGKKPLLIHFKNMSYEVVPYTGKENPVLYCVANENDGKEITAANYLYRDITRENSQLMKNMTSRQFDKNSLLNSTSSGFNSTNQLGSINQFGGSNSPYSGSSNQMGGAFNHNGNSAYDMNSERKHVNFSVKEVTAEIMQDLINKGYQYDTKLKINPQYETNDAAFSTQINRDPNKKNIRLCYYPFIETSNLNMFQESQIWKQSFCSPAFELIEPSPAVKTRHDKDAYCHSIGGRVPNIPELNGILKTLKINNVGVKYWTNNKISINVAGEQTPVVVYYQDSRFMRIKPVTDNESAYTFCIKNAATPSKIIANYKSKFKGLDGQPYAKGQCSSCQYYEVPDTILLSY